MRNVPDLDITLLSIFNRHDDGMTPERYHEVMENTEIRNEVTMLKLSEKLNIQASVKSDRYSLPYHKEIEHTNYGESYLNGAYEPERFFRKVVKQLLDENVYKIRFYVLMEVAEALPMGKVNFKFRYSI